MAERYADIIIDISHEKVDRPFQYRIPKPLWDSVYPGVQVHVPFGKGNHDRIGYVVEVSDKPNFTPERIKSITMVDPKGITIQSSQIQIAYWMKRQYGSTMINALKTVLPVKQKFKPVEKKKVTRLIGGEKLQKTIEDCEKKHQTAKARVLRALETEEVLPYELVRQKLNVASATLQSLEKQGFLRIEVESCYRNPVKRYREEEIRVFLKPEQQSIIDAVMQDYLEGKPQTYLLHGITGSGKTEVYLGIIEQMIALGKQAIVLIPEIALTYQTLLRFYKRFGDRVSVMNSSLSMGEKYDQMERAKKGDIDVIIGPRSALFTPFPNLGMIVIDEEHEASYKSESMPKYHARETAIAIAKLAGAGVMLGSATPSLEAYYRAKKGEYKLFEMTKRQVNSELPSVYTIDLREELKKGNRSIFSEKLRTLMEERLARREQTILFLNRRGYAGFISCRSCGHVMKCPHCDVSLSEHRNGKLICHYCGYEEVKRTNCPNCGSKYLMGFKAGTQQVEEAIHKQFPMAKVLRMDADTTRTKDSYEKILSAFADGQADILVGTQMIVKGHDFPNVTLVGVLAADLSLNQNDYHAAERTFQLLTQAAGRAGRGDKKGEVVIQTYQPEHYSIVHAAAQDFGAFYEEEVLYREMAQYPPIAHMLAVLVTAQTAEEGKFLCDALAGLVRKSISEAERVYLIGPAEATIGKINDIYRFVFYIRSDDYDRLITMKDEMEQYCDTLELKNQNVQYDFDPMNTY